MTTPAPAHLELTEDFRLIYSSGNENAPGDPFGECILTLEADGSARLDNRHVGEKRAWVGKVARETLARIVELLNAAEFPLVAPHRIPPGSTRMVVVRQNGQELHNYPIAWNEGGRMPGYKDVFRILDSIVVELSGGKIPVLREPEPGLVTEAAPAD